MKKSLTEIRRLSCARGLAVALILSLQLFGPSCQRGDTPNNDSEYLQGAPAEWDRLFNAGDAQGLAALYAEDAVSMPYGAPTVRGRQAIQAEFENFMAGNTGKHESFVEEILVGGDWAIERARYTMTYTPKATGVQIVETGRHVMCRRKVGGRWQIAWEIWNSDQPPPG